MLSPTISLPPSEGSNVLPTTTTRRRGLSYLRNLSHNHSPTTASDSSSRPSPRNFFTRSTSYQEARNQRPAVQRSRSASRPNEPTTPLASTPRLSRVITADNVESPRASSPSLLPVTTQSQNLETAENSDEMARTRATTSDRTSGERSTDTTSGRPIPPRTESTNVVNGDGEVTKPLPTIRFFPHQDLRAGRQSLNFSPMSRTLPTESAIIRIGRYSEREGPPTANPTTPSDAPVGFKSKVVSRKHCEFLFVDGQWQIKDVASSSGTFLNHIRLSQPNQESRLYPVKDGDIVQLGIDFRGGEEMIFRCVKIRIECNRSWQKKPNTFNKTRQAQLRGLTKDQQAMGTNSGECSICLGNVLPCQALFVAPCAHVWHYKCIRPMLEGRNSQYPQFQCPNCRAYTDLEADVDIAESDMDEWMDNSDSRDEHLQIDQADRGSTTQDETTTEPVAVVVESATPQPSLGGSGLLTRRQAANPGSSDTAPVNSIAMPAPMNEEEMQENLAQQRTNTGSPIADQIIAGEGPLTPRNNAGPFVFDGSAGRNGARRLIVPSTTISEISE